MYKKQKIQPTRLNINKSYEGETLENKIERIMSNKEPIKDGAPRIYTERKDGVQPQYNIRTDRWEIAVETAGIVDKHFKAKREERLGEKAKEGMKKENENEKNIGGAESTQGTEVK